METTKTLAYMPYARAKVVHNQAYMYVVGEMRKYKRIATILLSRNLGSYGAFRRVYI